ncbi:Thioredoxin [Entamoeba marina]
MLFFILLTSYISLATTTILSPFEVTVEDNPQFPILLVACKEFDNRCLQLQRIVNRTTTLLASDIPDLVGAVAPYSATESITPKNEPTLVLLRPNNPPIEYVDAWQTTLVANWAFQLIQPVTIDVSTTQELDSILNKEYDIVVVLYQKDTTNEQTVDFKNIAELQGRENIVFVIATGDNFNHILDNKQTLVKIHVKVGDKNQVFVHDGSEDLDLFISKGIFPLFSDFDPEYVQELNERYVLWLFYNKTLDESFEPFMLEIALQQRDTLVIVKFDIEMYPEQLAKYGVNDVPSLSIMHPNQRTTYPFTGEITKTNVLQFIDDVMNNKAQPFLMSRDMNEVEEGEIVGNVFEEYTHRDECVVVIGCVSTELCNDYKYEVFNPLRQRLEDTKVYYLRLDTDELPPSYEINDVPIIYIFPKNNSLIEVDNPLDKSQDDIAHIVIDICGGNDLGHVDVKPRIKEKDYEGQFDEIMKSLGLKSADLEDIDDVLFENDESDEYEDLLQQMDNDWAEGFNAEDINLEEDFDIDDILGKSDDLDDDIDDEYDGEYDDEYDDQDITQKEEL